MNGLKIARIQLQYQPTIAGLCRLDDGTEDARHARAINAEGFYDFAVGIEQRHRNPTLFDGLEVGKSRQMRSKRRFTTDYQSWKFDEEFGLVAEVRALEPCITRVARAFGLRLGVVRMTRIGSMMIILPGKEQGAAGQDNRDYDYQ